MSGKKMMLWLAAAAVVGGGVYIWKGRGERQTVLYRTAPVQRGDLVQEVRATGVIRPIRLVQVGTQVNGPVQKLYVDFNDTVKQGDLVAQIDPTVYEARLAQDEAGLRQNEASVEQARARLVQAEKDLERSRELAKREMLSQAELDAAIAERETLAAQLKVAEASVELARASLSLSRANLGYTTIRSPVDGVIIARNVDEGQTVVASMSAQVIFEIATDLREVQVEASVPEADIGRIRPDQPVRFTVDAYDTPFLGRVSQIRLAAKTEQNVVTYPVIVRAENPDGRLFPGMTATMSCEVARRENVLKASNAALRFRPTDAPAPSRSNGTAGTGAVWVQTNGKGAPEAITVGLGISDGIMTELTDAGSLGEGTELLTGIMDSTAEESSRSVNLFSPPAPPGSRRGRR
ncbi:MAG: efflux RND transporter periplasmic adaptor subunit [Kiritimatiellae bacterium]|nr:efflux RND transporter periplasmic adaptor subunit [Kiritimatiellia bacterium]